MAPEPTLPEDIPSEEIERRKLVWNVMMRRLLEEEAENLPVGLETLPPPGPLFRVEDYITIISRTSYESRIRSLDSPEVGGFEHWLLLLHFRSKSHSSGEGAENEHWHNYIASFTYNPKEIEYGSTKDIQVESQLEEIRGTFGAIRASEKGLIRLESDGRKALYKFLVGETDSSSIGTTSGGDGSSDTLKDFYWETCPLRPLLAEDVAIRVETSPSENVTEKMYIGSFYLTASPLGKADSQNDGGTRKRNAVKIIGAPKTWASSPDDEEEIRRAAVEDIAEYQFALAQAASVHDLKDFRYRYEGLQSIRLEDTSCGLSVSDWLRIRLKNLKTHARKELNSDTNPNANSESGRHVSTDFAVNSRPDTPSSVQSSSLISFDGSDKEDLVQVSEHQHVLGTELVVLPVQAIRMDENFDDLNGLEAHSLFPFSPSQSGPEEQINWITATVANQDDHQRRKMLEDISKLVELILESEITRKLGLWADAWTYSEAQAIEEKKRQKVKYLPQPCGEWSTLDQIMIDYERQKNPSEEVDLKPRFVGIGTWSNALVAPEWRVVLAPRFLRGPDVNDEEELERLNDAMKRYEYVEIEKTRLRKLYGDTLKKLWKKVNPEDRRDFSVFREAWNPTVHTVSDLVFMITMDLDVLLRGLEKLLKGRKKGWLDIEDSYTYDSETFLLDTDRWLSVVEIFAKATPELIDFNAADDWIKDAEGKIKESIDSYDIRFSENMFF